MFIVAPVRNAQDPSRTSARTLSREPAFASQEGYEKDVGRYAPDVELAIYERIELWPSMAIGHASAKPNPFAKVGFIQAVTIPADRDWLAVQTGMWEHLNRSFMRGNCWHFAIAAHDRTGLPIIGFKERRRPMFAEIPGVKTGGHVNHVALEIAKDETYFDGRGLLDYDEAIESVCGGNPIFVNLKRVDVARHAGARLASPAQKKADPNRVWMADEDESIHRRDLGALDAFYGAELGKIVEFTIQDQPVISSGLAPR
jgi:hypothetical protein